MSPFLSYYNFRIILFLTLLVAAIDLSAQRSQPSGVTQTYHGWTVALGVGAGKPPEFSLSPYVRAEDTIPSNPLGTSIFGRRVRFPVFHPTDSTELFYEQQLSIERSPLSSEVPIRLRLQIGYQFESGVWVYTSLGYQRNQYTIGLSPEDPIPGTFATDITDVRNRYLSTQLGGGYVFNRFGRFQPFASLGFLLLRGVSEQSNRRRVFYPDQSIRMFEPRQSEAVIFDLDLSTEFPVGFNYYLSPQLSLGLEVDLFFGPTSYGWLNFRYLLRS